MFSIDYTKIFFILFFYHEPHHAPPSSTNLPRFLKINLRCNEEKELRLE